MSFASTETTFSSATVVEAPLSQNVSAEQEVQFNCTSNDSAIAWAFSKNVGLLTSIEMMLPGGEIRSTRRFTASVEHNQTTVTCGVFGKTESYTALLLVQGIQY